MIEQRQQDVVEEFSFFDDWMDRYQYIIELGKTLKPMDPDLKIESNLIKGCQSNVWLFANQIEGKVEFVADSDAILTKGIIALLVRVYSGAHPDEILRAKSDFIDQIGLKEHLSPNRANGLVSMIKQIKMYALALSAKA